MMDSWVPSAQQELIAPYIAMGYSRHRASQLSGVPWRTQERWWAEIPEYREYIADMRAGMMEGYEQKFEDIILIALDIEHKALTGEADADDSRAKLAHDVLARTGYRVATQRAISSGPPAPAIPEPEPQKQLGAGAP